MKYLLRIASYLMRVFWFIARPVTLGVRLLPIQGDNVLLVHHTYQPGWSLPGGGVNRNETLERAIRREASEECGIRLNHVELFGTYTHFYNHKSDHVILFLSQEFTQTGESDHEIERLQFFPLNQLPPDLSSGTQRRIEEYLQGGRPRWGMW
jgi:ADP-ribose pyrophosphatase YjhB (NUDIX family)